MIRSIAHPTDFSPEGQVAFEHALRLALVNRCHLDVLHVADPGDESHWDRFPHAREVLQRWGFLAPGAHIDEILTQTGIELRKVAIRDVEVGDGLSRFIQSHRPDLIVMASHGRAGLSAWVSGSVSAEVARETVVPTLIFGPSARPFVDSLTGQIEMKQALVPVDHDPAPESAIRLLESLTEGLDVEFDLLHVGPRAPVILDGQLEQRTVRTINGAVVETILDQAQHAPLIAMPMAKRQGLLDTIRGSTTARVVREVTCPVLVLPAAS